METRCSLQAWFQHVSVGNQSDGYYEESANTEKNLDGYRCWIGKYARERMGRPCRRIDTDVAVIAHFLPQPSESDGGSRFVSSVG